MSFRVTTPVRFQDVDAAGVLFFGRIFDYCHQAYEELVIASGADPAHYFGGAPYLVPIAHAESDYRKPIRYRELITIVVDVTHVGKASFRLRYRVEGPAGDRRADVETVHAFVDRETMKPMPIPEPLRGFFRSHLVPEEVADRASS